MNLSEFYDIATLIKDGRVGQSFYPTPDTTVIIERIGDTYIEASVTQFTPSGRCIYDDRLVSFPRN
jgi:hypothetical protein